ncbi:MAG: hypothetical protein LBH31_06325 [Burkholderiaceae bacterium]|jgi:hypothetical protein|nr:hypothetical protein [Burkholderiaceae bacterium]
MPKLFANKKVGALATRAALLCGVAVAAPVAIAGGPALTFESVFQTRGEPPALYYRATFEGKDGAHTLQVWRDGQTRLRRKTDDAIDTYVLRSAADPLEFQMTIVDYRKRITTRIDRNNLIHLGNFSDWFDLAHGLRYPPAGAYRLVLATAPASAPAPVSACRWYALTQGQDTHRICWSAREHLPLVIWSDRTASAVWRVTRVEHQPISNKVFQLHDTGFVHNDANDDIDRD